MYTNNFSPFFVPAGSAALDIEAIDAAAAVHGEMLCVKKCRITRIGFFVSVLVAADTTVPQVEFNHRPTPGSATGETALADADGNSAITIPDATAVGTIVYRDIEPTVFEPGEALSLEHITQAADSGTAAGDGYYCFEAEEMSEEAANLDNMLETA